MFTSIDHIIIGVRDLQAATNTFAERLGLIPSGGGIHPAGGTANRIVVIGETYLELITVHKPEEAQESLRRRLEQAEGYLNFVLASDSIEADSQAIRQRGVTLFGPTPGNLRAGDGRSRAWMRANIERPDMVQRYPFIIQHDSAGEERRHRLAGWSTPPEHPLGASKVLNVTLAVANLPEASSRFAHIYGLQPSAPFLAASQGRAAQIVAFDLGASGQSIELAVPTDERAVPLAGDVLKRHLERFGEGLFRITLQVEDLARARRYLDERAIAYTMVEAAHPLLWIDPDQSCGAPIALKQV